MENKDHMALLTVKDVESSAGISLHPMPRRRAALLTLICAGLAVGTMSAIAAPATAAKPATSLGAHFNMRQNDSLVLPAPDGATYSIDEGEKLIDTTYADGKLMIKALQVGRVVITITTPRNVAQRYVMRITDMKPYEARAMELRPVAAPTPTPANRLLTAPAPTVAPLPSAVPTLSTGGTVAGPLTAPGTPARISPSLPPPSNRLPAPRVSYTPQGRLPQGINDSVVRANGGTPAVNITQGLARLITFREDILAVFFSDIAVMDARAINARTIAVTGLAPGRSTLAVFTARYPNDAVGRLNLYNILVDPRNSRPSAPVSAANVEEAIRTAIDDPRVDVAVITAPDGTYAAKLSGVVRNTAEENAATNTAALFVPKVISGIYVDPNAQTIADFRNPMAGAPALTADESLQASLRRATGNNTIEVVPLPDRVVLKATVGSREEAEALMDLLPSGQRVAPFIVIRGAAAPNGAVESSMFVSERPVMTPEDEAMSSKLQSVVGVRTVWVIRTAQNGLAIVGAVQNRTQYDIVRDYAIILPNLLTGQTGGIGGGGNSIDVTSEPLVKASAPTSNETFPNGVKLFVRILDPRGAMLRTVTAQTDVVEISRTALKNLGVQLGSVQLLTQTTTAAGAPTIVPAVINPVTGALISPQQVLPGSPATLTRTIDPTTIFGSFLGGNGFAGLESFQNINPIRVQLNALYQNGNAHILSSPNLTATEGNTAQILIGGQRPILEALSTGNGAVAQNVVFRPFGIQLNIRPTVTDDDSIIMNIRADITALDPNTAITVGAAVIPGETSRSINTTITMREGDVLVMGGLITNEKRQQTSKVPILSSLPIIGALFQSRRFENNESELAIILKPNLLRTPASTTTRTWASHYGPNSAFPDLATNQSTQAAGTATTAH